MNFCIIRLGKDSVAEIKEIDNSIVPVRHSLNILVRCTQVPNEVTLGTYCFVWLGSDNNKGAPTSWKQGLRAFGKVVAKKGGPKYNDQWQVYLEIGIVFSQSINQQDFLETASNLYAKFSGVPIIGVNTHSNQTVQVIDNSKKSKGDTKQDLTALFQSLLKIEPNLTGQVAQLYPNLNHFLSSSKDSGSALVNLKIDNVQIADNFSLQFGERLNIITGDNGLGKSFLLECAWWALTRTWTHHPIFPRVANESPSIDFTIATNAGHNEQFKANYDWKKQDWAITNTDEDPIPGLVVYARVDGAFAIWDPARTDLANNLKPSRMPSTLIISREDIWDGVRIEDGHRSRMIFNGLITDWVNWQNAKSHNFEILKTVLKRLSPPDTSHGDLGVLEPGEVIRIPGESRLIPTIKHPYGDVPLIFASAAVKRIVALAYLIVWAWEEHVAASTLRKEMPQPRMVVIADEIESHLHPQWQRVILPALIGVANDLSKVLNMQFVITTHSPMVMTSIEPKFDSRIDKVFHLNLSKNKTGFQEVILENPEFQKRGSADSWLVSNLFEMKQPRSIEAETAIEEAKQLQKQEKPNPTQVRSLNDKLLNLLPPHDTFWVRWNYFVEKQIPR